MGASTSRRRLRHPYLHVVVGSGVCLDLSLTPTARRRTPLSGSWRDTSSVPRFSPVPPIVAGIDRREHNRAGASAISHPASGGTACFICRAIGSMQSTARAKSRRARTLATHSIAAKRWKSRSANSRRASAALAQAPRSAHRLSAAPVPRPTSVASSPWREPLAQPVIRAGAVPSAERPGHRNQPRRRGELTWSQASQRRWRDPFRRNGRRSSHRSPGFFGTFGPRPHHCSA